MGQIRRVRFTKATQRHANIRENKGPSLNKYKSNFSISAVRTLWNFGIGIRRRLKNRSDVPAETRGDLPRISESSKKRTKQPSSHLPTNGVPAPSVIKPDEKEFVVDSGASMHMSSRKDLNSADLETVRVSKSPMTVVQANGEVHRKEEATVYVKELDLFVVRLLEVTLAVLSLGKFCQDHYSCEWTTGHNPQLIKDGRRIKCNTANYEPIVVPGLPTRSSGSAAPTSPHQFCRKQSIPHQQEVRVRVAQYGGQGGGSPRHVHNRRWRTREGPECACVQTLLRPGWHTRGGRGDGRNNVLPWYRPVGVV